MKLQNRKTIRDKNLKFELKFALINRIRRFFNFEIRTRTKVNGGGAIFEICTHFFVGYRKGMKGGEKSRCILIYIARNTRYTRNRIGRQPVLRALTGIDFHQYRL